MSVPTVSRHGPDGRARHSPHPLPRPLHGREQLWPWSSNNIGSGPSHLLQPLQRPFRISPLLPLDAREIPVCNVLPDLQAFELTAIPNPHAHVLDLARELHGLRDELPPIDLAFQPIRQRHDIERRLARGRDRVRAKASQRVPDEHHLVAHVEVLGRDDVGNALHERCLRLVRHLGHLRRQPRVAHPLHHFPRLPRNHARRDRDAPPPPLLVCHEFLQLRRAGGEIGVPDEVQQPVTRLRVPIFPRDSVSQILDAWLVITNCG